MAMMRSMLCGALLCGLAMVTGCQPKPAAQPASAELRQNLQKVSPNAAIGRVVAILPESNLIAIGDVQVSEFKVGDVVTLMGQEETPLANGKVISIVKDTLHVRYEPIANATRQPIVGDLAIRFKK